MNPAAIYTVPSFFLENPNVILPGKFAGLTSTAPVVSLKDYNLLLEKYEALEQRETYMTLRLLEQLNNLNKALLTFQTTVDSLK